MVIGSFHLVRPPTEVRIDGEELLIMKESDIGGDVPGRHADKARMRSIGHTGIFASEFLLNQVTC